MKLASTAMANPTAAQPSGTVTAPRQHTFVKNQPEPGQGRRRQSSRCDAVLVQQSIQGHTRHAKFPRRVGDVVAVPEQAGLNRLLLGLNPGFIQPIAITLIGLSDQAEVLGRDQAALGLDVELELLVLADRPRADASRRRLDVLRLDGRGFRNKVGTRQVPSC